MKGKGIMVYITDEQYKELEGLPRGFNFSAAVRDNFHLLIGKGKN